MTEEKTEQNLEKVEQKNEPKKGEQKVNAVWEFVRYALIALAIVVPFRIFIAQPYIVEGASMDPTFKTGDYLIVDQLSKRFEEPQRGSVIIIRYPKNPSKFFIKRLVGFPGETIKIENGVVYIFNDENKNGLKLEESYVVYEKKENFSAKLGSDEYFVMGDNRAGSSDSRAWGTLPKKYIIGRPIFRLWPLDKIDIWPGLY